METRTKKSAPTSVSANWVGICATCGQGFTVEDYWRIDCPACCGRLNWAHNSKAPKQPPPLGHRPESLRLIIAKLYASKPLNAEEQTAVDEIRDQYAATLHWQGILAHITEMIGSSGFVSEHVSQTKAAIELNVFPSESERYWNTLMAIGACAIEHYYYIEIRPQSPQRFEIRRLS